MLLNYIDVCSGISAPTMAWKPLGWRALCFAEIAAAPRAVLKHHYPEVPLHGDFTKIEGTEHGATDLIVGGTPCQGFSVAGFRGGLDDERSVLSLEFSRLAHRSRARWLVWENTPGAFSTNEGRDFGAILGEFSGRRGYVFERPADGWRNSGVVPPADERSFGLAWRVLDLLHFGIPQRRRRIILVGYIGDWRPSAAVLFERHSLSGFGPPRRGKGQAAPCLPARTSAGNSFGTDFELDGGLIPFEANCLTARMVKGINSDLNEGQTVVPVAFSAKDRLEEVCDNFSPPLRAGSHDKSHQNGGVMPAVAFSPDGVAARHLTPRECERLMGFPDDFTLVPYRKRMMADGPRYKMIGNSQGVPKIRWIGERIERVEALMTGGR